jgi:hypothetical protein
MFDQPLLPFNAITLKPREYTPFSGAENSPVLTLYPSLSLYETLSNFKGEFLLSVVVFVS